MTGPYFSFQSRFARLRETGELGSVSLLKTPAISKGIYAPWAPYEQSSRKNKNPNHCSRSSFDCFLEREGRQDRWDPLCNQRFPGAY